MRPSMVAAYSRCLTSAFAYGDNKPLERCVTMGKYTRANRIAGRMKVPKRMAAFIAVGISSQGVNTEEPYSGQPPSSPAVLCSCPVHECRASVSVTIEQIKVSETLFFVLIFADSKALTPQVQTWKRRVTTDILPADPKIFGASG